MLRHFMKTTGIYPVGSLVKLDSGDIGRVMKQTADIRRPILSLVERGGAPVSGDPTPYDLTRPQPNGPREIHELHHRPGEAQAKD